MTVDIWYGGYMIQWIRYMTQGIYAIVDVCYGMYELYDTIDICLKLATRLYVHLYILLKIYSSALLYLHHDSVMYVARSIYTWNLLSSAHDKSKGRRWVLFRYISLIYSNRQNRVRDIYLNACKPYRNLL